MVKVIFLENVEDSKVGDIKDVADGYARNYLFPNKLAVVASDEEMKSLESKIEKMKKEEEKKVAEVESVKEKIESLTLDIEAMVGEENKLYGSITNTDISEALAKKKIEVDKHDIEFPNQSNHRRAYRKGEAGTWCNSRYQNHSQTCSKVGGNIVRANVVSQELHWKDFSTRLARSK
jgi:large subunit ribosomal protein L9